MVTVLHTFPQSGHETFHRVTVIYKSVTGDEGGYFERVGGDLARRRGRDRDPDGTDALDAGELRTVVETIRRLDFGTEGREETLGDDEGDVVLVRSGAGVWSVPAGEVRAIWVHCRRLGLPEEGAALMLVAFREAGLG
jgi:hypothetical protein